MKEQDFKIVNDLLDIKNKCIRGLEQANKRLNMEPEPIGYDTIPEFIGYSCCISTSLDGARKNLIDLTGCCVGREIITAAIRILHEQIRDINKKLKEYGVEPNVGIGELNRDNSN